MNNDEMMNMLSETERHTITKFMAKDMLEHKHTWKKRMYRLRKDDKEFLNYKGESDTYIRKDYPQGVPVPMDVVEEIWSDVCIGNVVMEKIGEEWFSLHWYQSIEALEVGEQMTVFTQLVYGLIDNYGDEAQMAAIRECFYKNHHRGLFILEGRNISIPTSLIKKVVTAIDEGNLHVEEREGGVRDIRSTYSPHFFLEELWGMVA